MTPTSAWSYVVLPLGGSIVLAWYLHLYVVGTRLYVVRTVSFTFQMSVAKWREVENKFIPCKKACCLQIIIGDVGRNFHLLCCEGTVAPF